MDRDSYLNGMQAVLAELLSGRAGKKRFPWLNIDTSVSVQCVPPLLEELDEAATLSELVTLDRVKKLGLVEEDMRFLNQALTTNYDENWRFKTIAELRMELLSSIRFNRNGKPPNALVTLNTLLLSAGRAPVMHPFGSYALN